jgi:hypothetical protein
LGSWCDNNSFNINPNAYHEFVSPQFGAQTLIPNARHFFKVGATVNLAGLGGGWRH